MDTNKAAPEYLILFRGTGWDKSLSPDEAQQILVNWMAWFDGLAEAGKVKGGNPLSSAGKIVSGKGGRNVSDGPFAESKEAIGGYFHLRVDTLEEAVEIAQQCPGLDYGMSVEVREVAECCMLEQNTKERLATAAA